MIYKLAYKDDGHFDGFYLDDIHEFIPEKHINISEELWQELLTKIYKLKSIENLDGKTIYTLSNLDLFEEYVIEQSDIPQDPTIHDRVETLERENVDLLRSNFDLDFRVFEIECIIEDSTPATISLKGEKNMARTQYEQAKKLILLGEYERADMEYKLGRYRDRGVITVDQHNELIALMDADEMTAKQ